MIAYDGQIGRGCLQAALPVSSGEEAALYLWKPRQRPSVYPRTLLVCPHGSGPLPASQGTSLSCLAQTLGVSSRPGSLYRFPSLASPSPPSTLDLSQGGRKKDRQGQPWPSPPCPPPGGDNQTGWGCWAGGWPFTPIPTTPTPFHFPPPTLRGLPPTFN